MIGIRNIRVDYERELLLTSIILLYIRYFIIAVSILNEFYYIHEKEYHCHFLNYEFKGWVYIQNLQHENTVYISY